MKYQLIAFINSLKKSNIWLIIYILLLILNYYVIANLAPTISRENMLGVLGVIYNRDFIFTPHFLYFLYQVFTIIYVLHIYYIFEKNNSMEYTFCRVSKRSIVKLKIIISFFIIIIFRLFYSYVIYILCKHDVTFYTKDFIFSILEYVVIWGVYNLIFITKYLKKE